MLELHLDSSFGSANFLAHILKAGKLCGWRVGGDRINLKKNSHLGFLASRVSGRRTSSIAKVFLLHVLSLLLLFELLLFFSGANKELSSYLHGENTVIGSSLRQLSSACLSITVELNNSRMFAMQFPSSTFTTLFNYTQLARTLTLCIFNCEFSWIPRSANGMLNNKGSWHVPMSISTELFLWNIPSLSFYARLHIKVLLLTRSRQLRRKQIRNFILLLFFLSLKIGRVS